MVISIYFTWSCTSHKNSELAVHQIKFITGASNNKLEVLDWGGNGRPLIFLAGFPGTGHVFDEFAPNLTDSFHVYALTRRGFGASAPSSGYDMKTMASDILAMIDSLHLDKVILAGHSIAGDEMTRFAGIYPSRVDKLIYLDAAYDRTKVMQFVADFPAFPNPTARDSSSFANYKAFRKTVIGVDVPDDDIKQTSVFSESGKFLKDVTADSIFGLVFTSVEVPEYSKINAPALAIYAGTDSITLLIPFYNQLDSANKIKADKIYLLWKTYSAGEQTSFSKDVKQGTVKLIPDASHYLFISHPDKTGKMMRDFLK